MGEVLGRLRRNRATHLAVAGTFVLFVLAGSEMSVSRQLPARRPLDALGWTFVLAALSLLPLARRWPGRGLVASAVVVGVYLALAYPYGPVVFVVSVLACVVALTANGVRGALALGLSALILLCAQIPPGDPVAPDAQLGVLVAVVAAWVLLPAWLGLTVRVRREQAADRRRGDEQERADHDRAARLLADERLRLSRDLHDTVAHSLALISLQSGGALHGELRDPDRALAALQAIRVCSTDALRELRTAVTTLRDGGAAASGIGPGAARPGGAEAIRRLVDGVRHDGLEVRLEVLGRPRDLPGEIDGCVFRIAQEAITNVLRHAAAAHLVVRLEYGRDGLALDVADDGVGSLRSDGSDGGGHGLEGMRERAAAVGGTVEAGPRVGGGFRVHARIPLPSPD